MTDNARIEIVDNTILSPHESASLLNVAPAKLIRHIEQAKETMPDAAVATEDWLRKFVKPDERDERLRLSFWNEYNLATAGSVKRKMKMESILHGICNEAVWERVYLKNPRKLLWVLTPPKSYVQSMNYILHIGTERLAEIMSLPIVGEDGKVDHKSAGLVLKAFELVDMRVKGGILQKMQVEQKNLNMMVNQSSPDIESLRAIDDIERLEALSARLALSEGERGENN